MLFSSLLRGKRNIGVKTIHDHSRPCPHCNSLGSTVRVYMEYYHWLFIPFWPTGTKSIRIVCDFCGEPFRSDSLQKEYTTRTKAPFYLYAWPILCCSIIIAVFITVSYNEREKARMVAHPQVGDVYLIKQDSGMIFPYFFLRVARVKGDSVIAYNNKVQYDESTSSFDNKDYFSLEDTMTFTIPQLKDMSQKGVINEVSRGYAEATGFNRIK